MSNTLTDVRKDGTLWWRRPDGKTQVTIEYLEKANKAVEPREIHAIMISTHHYYCYYYYYCYCYWC
eukprot:10392037-Prorocentrum_lima.AAC.1